MDEGCRNHKIEIKNNAKPEKTQLEKRTSQRRGGEEEGEEVGQENKDHFRKKEKSKTEEHLKKKDRRTDGQAGRHEREEADKSSYSNNLLFLLSVHVFILWFLFFFLPTALQRAAEMPARHRTHAPAPHKVPKTCKREKGESNVKHARTHTHENRERKKRNPYKPQM